MSMLSKKNRSGKHKPGKVRIGIYLDPFRKAVALLVAEKSGKTLTDVIWQGIESMAIGFEILDVHGKISKEYKTKMVSIMAAVKQSKVNG